MALLHVNFFSDVLGMCTSADVILPQQTNGQIGMEAEVGDLNAGLAADLEHVGFVVIFHADVVHVHNALRHRAPPP